MKALATKKPVSIIALMAAMIIVLCLTSCGDGHHTYAGHNKGTQQTIAQQEMLEVENAEAKMRNDAFLKACLLVQFHYDLLSEYDSLEYESCSVTETDYDSYPYPFSGTAEFRDESGEEWIAEWSMQIRFEDGMKNATLVSGSESYGEPYKV